MIVDIPVTDEGQLRTRSGKTINFEMCSPHCDYKIDGEEHPNGTLVLDIHLYHSPVWVVEDMMSFHDSGNLGVQLSDEDWEVSFYMKMNGILDWTDLTDLTIVKLSDTESIVKVLLTYRDHRLSRTWSV